MNKIINTIKIAYTNLKRHKGRTTLSILGITVGIATVIIIFSTGEAIKFILEEQVKSFGTDYIEVEVKVPSVKQESGANVTGIAQGVAITTLKIKDAEDIKKLPNVKDYYAGTLDQKIISYQGYDDNSFIYGVSSAFIDIDPGEVKNGSFFTKEEENSLSQVAVLGSKLAKKIYGNDNPVGKNLRIQKNNYKVIGVMKERGASMFFDQDNLVYVPLKTLQKKLTGIDYFTFVVFSVYDVSISDFTAKQMEDILRYNHNIKDPSRDDFGVTTYEEGLSILGNVTGAASILLLLLASISLIVGGVGIMNIMFVTVTERIPEIGLRKAIGATNKDIKSQFLTESAFITFVGGVIGVVLGVVVVVLVSFIANSKGFEWPIIFKFNAFLISVIVAVLVGIVAGYLPAKKASLLDPIVALRK